MEQHRTHHRAVALVLAVAAVVGLSRAAPPAPVTIPEALTPPPDAGPLRVDPRTASARELESLPGVGPSIARRIVEARARGVEFRRPEDLGRVRGIGPRTVERLAPHLDFSGPTGRRAASPPR